MTSNQHTSKSTKFRTFMKYVWGDQVAANRALMQLRPYDDYLMNRRAGH
ncbi:MAG: hypothetical protein QM747_05815 [Nocardioides sp.]